MKRAFKTLEKEVDAFITQSGCVLGALFKSKTQTFFVQIGDTVLLGIKDGEVVVEARAHNCITEKRRVNKYTLNNRLFGILEPTRGFGNSDLREAVITSWGTQWDNKKKIFNGKPEITIINEDIDYFVIASDGLLDTKFSKTDRDFKEELEKAQEIIKEKELTNSNINTTYSRTIKVFEQIVLSGKNNSNDDIAAIFVYPS